MAATLLQEAYDCVVLGSGRTAALVAAAVARTGRQTLRLSSAAHARPAWLHPRWGLTADGDENQRSPLSGVCVVNPAGQRTTMLRSAASAAGLPRATAAETFFLPPGCQLNCAAPHEIRLNGALPPTTIRAGLIVAVESAADETRQPSAIGGVYRDVACDLGEERQALLFATHRAGEVFWLVPLDDGRWSLGLLTSEQPADDSLADTFEEALVACPALTQRLISAELIGGLHLSQAAGSSIAHEPWPGAIRVPEYDGWLDPVFASSDWLGTELAGQVALRLPSAEACEDQLTAWQQDWSAVEQLTSERIAPWYRLHDTLPAALHDHAQRTWYEKLLAGQRAR